MNISINKESELKRVYDNYYHKLLFYAGKYLADMDECKDIVQDILVKVWEKKLEFENEYALSAYLYSGVYHRCMNHLEQTDIHRKHHAKIEELYRDTYHRDYVSDRIENEVLQEIFSAIDALPPECRRIFEMSYIEGCDIAKVAEALNISQHTVKSQRARAKKLLQERLKNLFPIFILYFNL